MNKDRYKELLVELEQSVSSIDQTLNDIDDETVWVGVSTPLVKIGLGIDCWTSFVVYPYKKKWDVLMGNIDVSENPE
jgi:hypothetical protein